MSTTSNPAATRPPPSRWWYVFGLFLGVCGFVFMAAFLVPRVLAMGDGLQQVVMPGVAQLQLRETGRYTIFHERETIVNNEVYSSPTVSGLRVKVTAVSHARAVAVSPASVSSNYNIGGRSGRALLMFDVDQVGTYRIEGGYRNGAATPRVVLAIGHEYVGDLLTTIFGALAIAFTGVLSGVVVAVMTWRKRRAAHRA